SWDVTGGTTFATTGGGTFTDNRFKAGAAGTFTITATYLDLTTTTTVNIKSHGEAVGLSLHLSPDTITADGAVTCAVYGTDINGISWNATSEVTIFSTQDPKGTFANNIYYPGQVGEWAITAEMGTLRATAAVSVSHGAVVYLEIAPDSVSLTADDQQEYRGTAIDNDGNQWDATEEITWSEDDPIGAMAANVYYPGQAGTWTITATYTTVIDTSTVEVASGAFVDLSISAPTAITTHTTFTLTVSLYDGHDNPYSGDVAMTNSTKSITPDKIILTSGTWTGQAVITQSPVGGVDTITVSHNSVKAAAAMTVFLNSELGGTVTDEGAAIEFDPGDLGTTNVTVHIDTSTLLPEPLPGAIRFAGIVYDIELIDEQGNKIGTQTGQIGTVVVYLSYPDANNDGWVDGTWIREEDLIIYQFENGTWIPLPTNVDQAENVAWAYVEHFSIFTLGGIETIPYADNIDSIHVYPNPYVPYDDDSDNGIPYDGSPNSGITFEELTENARIRIFKLAGNLVREESGRRTCPYCRRETKRDGVNPR
ncbi:hypothetical protein KKC52_09190, partial [bacterium]|nr:hypothetical protein [bacterium]